MATNDLVWIGGLVELPAVVSGSDGEAIQPKAILWMLPSGIILGIDLLAQGAPTSEIVQSFFRATQTPSKGEPCVPSRLRIADPELAQALRTQLKPGTKVLCEPTPELDVVAAAMAEHLANSEDQSLTYVVEGVSSESLGVFFEAASRLFRAAPWKVIPQDRDILSLNIPEFGISNWALSVIGQAGESFGIVLFRSREDFWSFASAAFGTKVDATHIPWHLSLSFHKKGELPPSLRQELATYGWKVAGSKAYPLLTVGDQREARAATAEELSVTIAVCNALAVLTATEPWLKRAWSDPSRAIARTLSVVTPTGPAQVAFRAPFGLEDSQRDEQGFDIYARVLDPEGGFEEEWFRSYCEELLRRFKASPEAKELERIGWAELLLDYGGDYLGVTVADMTPDILDELVFSVFPRKVSCEARDAPKIVREFRAFFAFLGREFRLGNARGCLRVLEGADGRLRKELSNPRSFGLAKQFFLAGQQAGFDVTTEEGLQAWVRTANAEPDAFNPFGDALPIGFPTEDRRRTRNKRKKARQKMR